MQPMDLVSSVFKTARPIHTENPAPQMADRLMTKLDDYKASIERENKQLLRKREGANR